VISGHPRDVGNGSRVAILAIVDGTMHYNEIEIGQEFDSAAARHFTS
jgi:hypothetical protein